MIRLTFAQMRRSVGRLTAAGIAIAIGSAFIVVTLLAGNIISRTTYDSISASLGKADVVITFKTDYWTVPSDAKSYVDQNDIDKIGQLEGVDAVLPDAGRYEMIEGPARSEYQRLIGTSSDSRLNALTVAKGSLPSADDEIAVPTDQAERLGLTVGDTASIHITNYGVSVENEDGTFTEAPEEQVVKELTVVGLLDDPYGAYAMDGGASMVTLGALSSWQVPGEDPMFSGATIALAEDADTQAMIDEVARVINAPGLDVQTRDDAAAQRADQFTGGEDVLTNVVLAFAGLALLVAGLVISNTFQVLVAQRTQTLAMLRCIGANKRQLRSSVRLEAAVLGLVSALAGIALGCLFGQGTLMILGQMNLSVPLPSTISVTPAVFWLPILASLVVTMIAAMAPARAATRVSPLAALRPAEAPSVRHGGAVRLVFSILLTVVGFVLLGCGIAWSTGSSPEFALLVGLVGGALSFVGLIIGAVFWIPRVTGLVGRLLARTGPSGKLAAANIVRNPRRTAATSTALLIGVTLVAMMSTGAISARQTLSEGLDESFPIDAWASSYADGPVEQGPFSSAVRSEITAIDGVDAVVPVSSTIAEVNGDGGHQVYAVDKAAGAAAGRDAHMLDKLSDSSVLLSSDVAYELGIKTGDQVELRIRPDSGAADPQSKPLRLQAAIGGPFASLGVTAQNMAQLDPSAALSDLWISFTDDAQAYNTVVDVQDVLGDTEVMVTGAAVERAMFEQVIDVLLAVVLG